MFFGGWLPRKYRGYCCCVCMMGALELGELIERGTLSVWQSSDEVQLQGDAHCIQLPEHSPCKVVKEKKSFGKLGLAIEEPPYKSFCLITLSSSRQPL